MKTIQLVEFGTSLISRETAKKVFNLAKDNNFQVIFDAKNVEFISTSFSDELFAKGRREFGQVFKIIHVKNELIKLSIKQALITREKFLKV